MPQSFSRQSVGGVVQDCPLRKNPVVPVTFVAIELVGEDDLPVAGEEYLIVLPNGDKVKGFLDANGRARVEGIEQPGDCQVSFPGLDEEAWTAAGLTGPSLGV
jgi:hypothetical protein